MKHEHITASGKNGKLVLKCAVCKTTVEYELPQSTKDVERLGNKFIDKHKDCRLGYSKK